LWFVDLFKLRTNETAYKNKKQLWYMMNKHCSPDMKVAVYKSLDGTFFVCKANIFIDIKTVIEYIKKTYNTTNISIESMKPDVDAYWKNKIKDMQNNS